MTVKFGTNSSANETLHKSISLGDDIECIVKEPIDILAPYLIVKNTDVELTDNYAQITDTNRYYFITVVDLPGGRRGVKCTVDPLMSFASGIDKLEVNVERYEGSAESDIYDTGVCQTARNEVIIEKFGGTNEFVKASANTDRCYILTVAN